MKDSENKVTAATEGTTTEVNGGAEHSIPVDILLQRAFDGIIVIDAEQRILSFNKGAEQVFGYQANELIGQKIDVLIPTRFVDRHQARPARPSASPGPRYCPGAGGLS